MGVFSLVQVYVAHCYSAQCLYTPLSTPVNGGQWWPVVVNGGQWWSMVVSSGQWWSMVVNPILLSLQCDHVPVTNDILRL